MTTPWEMFRVIATLWMTWCNASLDRTLEVGNWMFPDAIPFDD